jgi:hypothetical protein
MPTGQVLACPVELTAALLHTRYPAYTAVAFGGGAGLKSLIVSAFKST